MIVSGECDAIQTDSGSQLAPIDPAGALLFSLDRVVFQRQQQKRMGLLVRLLSGTNVR